MLIREMTAGDLPKVAALERRCFSDPWSEAIFRQSLTNPQSRFFVAVSEDGIAGYAELAFALDEGDLTNIAVSPEFRRQGLGQALLDRVIGTASELKLSRLFLEVRVSNEPAIRLYEKNGFTDVGLRKDYYTDPREDARVMMKTEDMT